MDEHAKQQQWPPILYNMTDEPRVLAQANEQLELMRLYRSAVPFVRIGGSYSVHWDKDDDLNRAIQEIFKILTWSALNVHNQTDIDKAKEFGRDLYIYNQGRSRFSFGPYQFAEMRKGVRGRIQWHALALHGYQFFDLDGREPDTAMFNWGRNGLIPTIHLPRCREGADDFRYAVTLWNLAERHKGQAKADAARAWLQRISEAIPAGERNAPTVSRPATRSGISASSTFRRSAERHVSFDLITWRQPPPLCVARVSNPCLSRRWRSARTGWKPVPRGCETEPRPFDTGVAPRPEEHGRDAHATEVNAAAFGYTQRMHRRRRGIPAFTLFVAWLVFGPTRATLAQSMNDLRTVHPDRRITFRVDAPDARTVQVKAFNENTGLLGGPFGLAKDKDGIWAVTTPPVEPGFFYYQLVIDGTSVADPSSPPYYGWGRFATTSIGGSASNATPGGVFRRGPANWNGDARSLHIGSVRTLSPPICTRNVACPTHVTVTASGAARGVAKLGVIAGNVGGPGSRGRRWVSRSTSTHFRNARKPATAALGHGLRKPPPGR